MNVKSLVFALAIGLGIPYVAIADGDHSKGAHATSATDAALTTGEIKKVDKDASKIPSSMGPSRT